MRTQLTIQLQRADNGYTVRVQSDVAADNCFSIVAPGEVSAFIQTKLAASLIPPDGQAIPITGPIPTGGTPAPTSPPISTAAH